jgi:hypothetical protein
MKAQLVERLQQLLNTEDIISIRDAVRDVRNDWKAETAKERQLQQEEFKAAEHPEGTEFVFEPHETEESFRTLLATYDDRVEEHGKKLAAERQQNFDSKSKLLAELETLVKGEENIGKAFATFNGIKEKWDTIGDVPGDKHHELHESFHKLAHEFFYNINIYKSLQDHDLKINQKKKEELIAASVALAEVQSIPELEVMVRKFQREWMDIGPSPRETYKELGDQFFAVLREAQTRIRSHYEKLEENHEQALANKRAVIEKMKAILEKETGNLGAWNKLTDETIALQEEWKNTGWARKKDNDEAWNEFRGLCDLFFERRGKFMGDRRAGYKDNRTKKEALIAKAKELQDSTDWKNTTEVFKKLQADWKGIGAADPRDEMKLWQQFRSSSDHFFKNKKEHTSNIAQEQVGNLEKKEELLKEIEEYQLTGQKAEDLKYLKEFSERWHSVGFIPKDNLKDIIDRYTKALDSKYGSINAEREEQEMNRFRSRVSNIKSGDNGQNNMRREEQFMREKIDRLKKDIQQYENNMTIFTGKGAEALRKDIEKKIQSAQREIEDIRKKIDLLKTV